MTRWLLLGLVTWGVSACASGFIGSEGIAGGYAALDGYPPPSVTVAIPLLVFGDSQHRTFLGCLTCPRSDPESILNPLGPYGNALSATSLLNRFSLVGNRQSLFSPCNPLAFEPPILVDPSGGYYGELTVNPTRPDRTRLAPVQLWLTGFCIGR